MSDVDDATATGTGALEPALEELRARLAADLEALLAAVQGLEQGQADWKPAPQRWSVAEVLHHLVLSNRAFARAVAALVQRGRTEGLVAPATSRRSWPRMRTIADVRASGPVVNPPMATPTPGLAIETLRREVAASHAAVVEQLPALTGLDLAALRLPHPLGFELNLYQWADIAGAHERRHLAQILALTADPAFPPRA
jgi:hypothetical protein